MTWCLLFLWVLLYPCFSLINLYRDGDFIQCNPEPSYVITPLSISDQSKVNKLKFVQALFRHGIRLQQQLYGPDVLFPDYAAANFPEWAIQCNVSSVLHYQYVDVSANSPLRIRKQYPLGQQYYKNSNCAHTQSVWQSIPQMEAIANTVKNAYIANKYDTRREKRYLFKKKDINKDSVQLYATDFVRITDSIYWFTRYLLDLDDDDRRGKEVGLDLIIHDVQTEPFRIDLNVPCRNEPQWQQWNDLYAASTNNSKVRSDFGQVLFY